MKEPAFANAELPAPDVKLIGTAAISLFVPNLKEMGAQRRRGNAYIPRRSPRAISSTVAVRGTRIVVVRGAGGGKGSITGIQKLAWKIRVDQEETRVVLMQEAGSVVQGLLVMTKGRIRPTHAVIS